MPKKRSRHRFTIGFLGDNLVDGFEGPIWSSAARAAREFDINLIGYAGGPLPTWYRNKFDYLINTEIIDGVIAISGTLGSLSKNEELTQFFKRFASLPIVSISRPFPNSLNLLVDNEDGIHQIVKHLIEVHHYRKLVFIGGPEKNPEANLRLKAYKDSLAYYDIPYNPDTVYYGNFWDDGIRAIQVFLDERKLSFDAVVAANDFTALYAIKELQRRGFSIPQDIAVTGFDDIQESRSATPSITTIGQPLADLGTESIKSIISLLQGDWPSNGIRYLSPTLFIRRSCGCATPHDFKNDIPNSIAFSITTREKEEPQLVKINLTKQLGHAFPEIDKNVSIRNWAQDLIEFLSDPVMFKTQFISLWSNMLTQGFENSVHVSTWYTLINSLHQCVGALHHDHADENDWDALIIYASQLVGIMAERYQTNKQRKFIEEFDMIKRIYYSLNIILTDDQNLIRFLEDFVADFPKFQINSFYFSQYENSPEKARLCYSFDLNHRFNNNSRENEAFFSRHLVPGDLNPGRKRYTLLVVPVFEIGFAMYDVDAMDDLAYHSFFSLINNAIKLLVMTMEFLKNAKELEKKVEDRTRQLKEAQQQMLETAHRAGMAEVAVGVMHNAGNLLNSVNISADEIDNITTHTHIETLIKANELLMTHQGHLSEYFANDPKAHLLPDFYEKIGESLLHDQVRIGKEVAQLRNKISLIHEIIQGLQEYARNNQEIKFEEVTDIATIIEDAIKINESSIRKNQIKIIKDYATIKPYQIQKTKLTHILVNLVKNSVEAMDKISGKRILTIKLYIDSQQIPIIKMIDTGEGIAHENLGKVFTYGFTTKTNGHGFGLHTCANYIHEMGGAISVSSPGPGEGSVFTLKLPKPS